MDGGRGSPHIRAVGGGPEGGTQPRRGAVLRGFDATAHSPLEEEIVKHLQ